MRYFPDLRPEFGAGECLPERSDKASSVDSSRADPPETTTVFDSSKVGSWSVGSHDSAKPTPSSGSSRLVRTRSIPGSPDPFDGDNGGRSVGSHDSVKSPAMETTKKDGVQMVPAIGTSMKATNFGYDPLFRRFALVNSDPISKSVVLGPLCGRICLLTMHVRLAQKGDMFFDSEDLKKKTKVH